VNVELKRLEAQGLIEVGYRVIALRDVGRLHALAGPDIFAF
jgi:Mn-dependent DtxR family transcriptional regulator